MVLLPALFSHYRRHPLQLLALALMIVIATSLWTGVSQLTSQARASLGQSEQAMVSRIQVQRVDGQPLTVADFVALRRAGHCVMPWLEVERPAPAGRVVGIDPLAASCFGQSGESASGWEQPLDGEPFMDIRAAKELAETEEATGSSLSLLLAGQRDLPEAYRRASFSLGPDTGELGESFLLNLDALGFLVLLITALLLRSVYQLGLAQRRETFALLHRFGVPPAAVNRTLVVEIVLLAAVCVLPGVGLGQLLAGVLGSGFGQALDSLFDLPLYAGQGGSWLQPALTMMAVVLVICLAGQWRPFWRQWFRPSRRHIGVYAQASLLIGAVLALFASSLALTFLAVALVFVGAGVLAPWAIARLARRCSVATVDPVRRWRYAELGVLARRLALPLVALQFALAMVLAVQALVTVFEATFDDWLSQRLAADYFVEVPVNADSRPAVAWLDSQSPLAGTDQWHRVVRGRARLPDVDQGLPQSVDLLALAPVSSMLSDWRLLAATDQPWQAFARGGGLMVNEQLARRQQLAVGDGLALTVAGETLELPVLAIYPDYGRPAGEVLVSADHLPAAFKPNFESLAITPRPGQMATVTAGLKEIWGASELTVRDNGRIRALADTVFDQTFVLTQAMTLLTLILAAASLLIMGWVFFSTRVWYYRLLTVWGMRQREVAGQLVQLSVALTTGIALLALPLGIWLTWVLVHRINPLAFGWSLPMAVYPDFWLELGLLSLLVGLSIAALMRRQLRHPAAMPASARALAGGER